jgi:type I restriction enzyme, S subunit
MQVMTDNKLVPKLRFLDFEGVWNIKKLRNISDFFSGGTPTSTNKSYYNGDIPFIKSGEINNDKTVQFLSEEGFKSSSAKMVNSGDLLYALYGATSGEVGISKINGAINQAILCIRTEEERGFLCNYLKYNKARIVSKYLQGGQGNLSADIIKDLRIAFPTFPEQQKIASFLSAVDDKLQQLKKKKELLEEYKKGVMQKIFSQELRFKDDNGNNYPSWEEKRLNEVFHSKRGSGLSGKNIVSDGKNKCILYGALYTKYDEVIDEVIESTNEDGKVKSQIGDILVPASTTTTGIDLANFTALNQEGVLLGGDISILRFSKKGHNVYWAYYLTHYKKYEVASFAQGSTIVHIYFSHFGKTQIEEPTIEEQHKIANFLSSLDSKIKLVSTQIEKTKFFKKGLLQQMFV